MEYSIVDKQGDVNICIENTWKELKLFKSRTFCHILGSSLNGLMLFCFMLMGNEQLTDKDFPGGVPSWKEVVGPFYASLPLIADIDEVLLRIKYLSKLAELDTTKLNIFYGSVRFLYYWFKCFDKYISDMDLLKIRDRMEFLYSVHVGHGKFFVYHTNLNNLKEISNEVIRRRMNNVVGLSLSPNLNPNFRLLKGEWTGFELVQKRKELKEKLKGGGKAVAIKLEIFGADQLIDEIDEDDEEDNKEPAATTKSTTDKEAVPFPTVRIQDGYSLLQTPNAIAVDVLHLDTLEIARQWSLIDQQLFTAIPLHSFLKYTVNTPTRLEQLQLGNNFQGVCGGIKRFIDRFNAVSLWISQSILKSNIPEQRCSILVKFISIAAHLYQMCNFNGVMIVMTALQQGCIARLKVSWDMVPKTDLSQYTKLQKLMSGSKNYRNYRAELQRLCKQLFDPSTSHKHLTIPMEELIDNDWQEDLHRRYHIKSFKTHENVIAAALEEESRTAGLSGLMSEGTADPGADDDLAGGAEHYIADVEAIVPHLGAHLSQLTAIQEGNSSFLPDNPHLFNVTKFQLFYQTLSQLALIQKLRYHYQPVRAVMAALNLEAKRNMHLTSAASMAAGKKLYELSEALESADDIAKYFNDQKNGVTSTNGSAAGSRKEQVLGVRFSNKDERPVHRTKYRKSDAYNRIMSGAAAKGGDDESDGGRKVSKSKSQGSEDDGSDENSDEDEESEEEVESGKKKKSFFRTASNLLRTMSFRQREK